MEIRTKTFRESVYSIIDALEEHGHIKDVFANKQDSNKSDIYGGNSCLEISPLTNIIEKPLDMFPIIPGRGNHFIMQLAEIIWVLNGKKNIQEFFGQFASPAVQKFSHYTDELYAAYGYRLRHQPDGNDILKYLVETLQKKISSRSAVFPIFNAEMDTMGGEHKPCATTFQLHLYDGGLDGILTLRANDLLKGYSAINFQEFAFIQAVIAYVLNVPLGRFVNFTSTMHYYTGEAKERIDRIKQFRGINTPETITSTEDWFNYEIGIESRLDTVYKDFENIYESLKLENPVEPSKFNHPIFAGIYKILDSYKSNKDISYTYELLPSFLGLPYLENMYRNHAEEVEKIVDGKNDFENVKEAIMWRNKK